MPASRAVPVTLTAAERKTLKKRARGAKTAYRDRQRAQIVLLAARRWPTAAIAGRGDRRPPFDRRGHRPQVARPVRRPRPGRAGRCPPAGAAAADQRG